MLIRSRNARNGCRPVPRWLAACRCRSRYGDAQQRPRIGRFLALGAVAGTGANAAAYLSTVAAVPVWAVFMGWVAYFTRGHSGRDGLISYATIIFIILGAPFPSDDGSRAREHPAELLSLLRPVLVPVSIAVLRPKVRMAGRLAFVRACDRALARMSRLIAKGVSVHSRRALSIARSLFSVRCPKALQ